MRSLKEVEEEVIKRIRGFSPDGGYILAPSHNIQIDTPLRKSIKMYKAVQKYGKY